MSKLTIPEKKIVKGLEALVGRRFNKASLEVELSKIFGHPATVEDISKEDDELADYNFLTNFDGDKTAIYGYADIYFLPMRREGFDGATFYVTEVSYEFE
jgi:hypothetical protein